MNNCRKRAPMLVLTVLLLLMSVVIGICIYRLANTKTAVIVRSENELHDTSDGQIRVRISSDISVIEDTMQNLNFENINEGRLMRCFIILDGQDSYCYRSQYIEPGEIIAADVIDSSQLDAGSNSGVAELYTYEMGTKEQIGHVNVRVNLER